MIPSRAWKCPRTSSCHGKGATSIPPRTSVEVHDNVPLYVFYRTFVSTSDRRPLDQRKTLAGPCHHRHLPHWGHVRTWKGRQTPARRGPCPGPFRGSFQIEKARLELVEHPEKGSSPSEQLDSSRWLRTTNSMNNHMHARCAEKIATVLDHHLWKKELFAKTASHMQSPSVAIKWPDKRNNNDLIAHSLLLEWTGYRHLRKCLHWNGRLWACTYLP